MKTKTPTRSRARRDCTALISAAATLVVGSALMTPVSACTDFMLPEPPASMASVPGNLTAVSARTMDFEVNLGWQMQNQSAGHVVQSTHPNEKEEMLGLKWVSLYKLIGFTGLQYVNKLDPANPIINDGLYFDGMNEKGLSAALLWLDATWPSEKENNYPAPRRGDNNLSVHYVVNYVLSRCDTAQCVANLLQVSPQPIIWGEFLGGEVGKMPLAAHLVVHDANNRSLVVEWLDKKQFVYWDEDKQKNPVDRVRVMTNDPPYPDQIAMLKNPLFTNLNKANHFKESKEYITAPEENLLPGDSSSGSRFVRSFKLNRALSGNPSFRYRPYYYIGLPKSAPMDHFVVPSLWRVQLANKVIARAEEVYGEYPAVFKRSDDPADDLKAYFHTQFTVIGDHSNKILYVRGIYNQNLRRIVLSDVFKGNPESYTRNLYVDPFSKGSHYKLQMFQDVADQFEKELPSPYEK